MKFFLLQIFSFSLMERQSLNEQNLANWKKSFGDLAYRLDEQIEEYDLQMNSSIFIMTCIFFLTCMYFNSDLHVFLSWLSCSFILTFMCGLQLNLINLDYLWLLWLIKSKKIYRYVISVLFSCSHFFPFSLISFPFLLRNFWFMDQVLCVLWLRLSIFDILLFFLPPFYFFLPPIL